jgi:uncharacterized protein YggE
MMENVREILVVGEGSASAPPDRCLLSLALNVAADSSAEALDRVAALAGDVLVVVHDQGVDVRDVQTQNITLQDLFDQETKRVTARVASYAFSVKAPGLDGVGTLVAAVASVAGDAFQIRHLDLIVDDARPLADEARREAVADALRRGSQLADAAGVRIGAILSIDEDGEARPQGTHRRVSSGATFAAAVPVEAGTATVTIHVRVRLAIED